MLRSSLHLLAELNSKSRMNGTVAMRPFSVVTLGPAAARPELRKSSSLKCGVLWHSTQPALPANSWSPRLAAEAIAVVTPAT